MKRRSFIAAAGALGAGLAASSFPRPAISQGKKQLKMVMTWPKNSPGLGTSAQRIADRITQHSGGQLEVKLYGAGELVPAFESFGAVSAGDADIYHGAEYYWQGKSKAYNYFTTVPFGLNGLETHAWILYGGGQKLWDELSAGFNIKPFAVASTGVQMAGWFRKEINTLDDFKGLKMRIPGLGGEVLRQLGTAVINLPVGEIFPSLQSGAIDATEWVGPWHDLAFGFYKVTKNYYYPGWHEPGTVASIGVNKKLYDSLTKDQQQMIEVVCNAEAFEQSAEFNARNLDSLNVLISKHGVSLRRLNDDLLREIGKVAEQTVADVGNSDAITKKVYESFLAYRKGAMEWANISERAMMNARQLQIG
jgi:TRAP-type mannitol/chloroaromatic compound transport system substrate-binding protein